MAISCRSVIPLSVDCILPGIWYTFLEVINIIDMEKWLAQYLFALDETFKDRVWFVGLQGSRGRGEASDTSDIDMVVILDALRAEDIGAYGAMLDRLPHRELSCGFLSGRAEIVAWEPSDLFSLYSDTIPLRGSLDAILPLLDGEAVDRAIRMGACNLYHGCVHNMVHGRSEAVLRGLYKGASFVAQAIAYRQTGRYFLHQQELREILSTEDRQIVDIFLNLKRDGTADFEEISRVLFEWSGRLIRDGGN